MSDLARLAAAELEPFEVVVPEAMFPPGPFVAPPDVGPEVWRSFSDFWAEIVAPAGRRDLAQVMRELHDYRTLLDEVPKVYSAITAGLLSKPNTAADAVLAAHEDSCHRDCVDREELEYPNRGGGLVRVPLPGMSGSTFERLAAVDDE